MKTIKKSFEEHDGTNRLSLAVISIENELLKTFDFSDIISTFADQKYRRKAF